MDQVCQQKRNPIKNQQSIGGNKELLSYKRINSPGLPNSSLRTSCKVDKKRLEIGLITDRKLSESPNFDRMFSTGNFKMLKQKNSVIDIPQQLSQIPKIEPKMKRNFKMIEKLESDKLCLKIYISEEDQNQLIFTGISKEKLQSPNQNKKALIKNLRQLFLNDIAEDNHYMKQESLQQKNINCEDQLYYGLLKNNHSNSNKRIYTQTNESKSNQDRSLSISTIQEYKSNISSKIKKDIEILDRGLNRQRKNQEQNSNSRFQKSQPLSQYNLTINLKCKQKGCIISSQNKKASSPSFSYQRNSQQKCINKQKSNIKSLQV
ncbi:unnamed protein product [Paramecium sonneborni]|uniref:Uncharacterized protein n=1 Tax=Paramecium sonneborni TaxID=65129 RepID=A0A8S1KZ34_9CILI|nr:unnamed protein product [Paramecium sonneborni]